jgi:hypothetical protein
MNNPILQDFLRMRAALNARKPDPKPTKPINALHDVELGAKLTEIIENKPHKKEVEEYFKKKAELLGKDI